MRSAFFLCILVASAALFVGTWAFVPPATSTNHALLSMSSLASTPVLHTVDDLVCRERHIQLPSSVGKVTVLEATEETQLELDQMAMAVALGLSPKGGDDSVKLKNGDVHGASLWPSSCAVANYLLDHKEELALTCPSTTVLELGAGSGLVSITAALQGASVIATDFEPFPLRMTEYAATKLNHHHHHHNNNNNDPAPLLKLETKFLDICRHEQEPLPVAADLVIAADVNYEPATAEALAKRTVQALSQGSRVIIGDQKERPGHGHFVQTLTKLMGVHPTSIPIVETTGETLDPSILDLDQIIELPVQIVDLKPSVLVQQSS